MRELIARLLRRLARNLSRRMYLVSMDPKERRMRRELSADMEFVDA